MATTQRIMTADEFYRLPREGRRRLIAGRLISLSPGNKRHGKYAMRLSIPLGAFVYAHGLGEVYAAETGFQLDRDPDTVQAPDLAFASRARADAAEEAEGPWWPGAPDLAVEVVSPNDTFSEVTETVDTWLRHDTRVVVVIDPRRRSVSLHRPASTPGRTDEQMLGEADLLTIPELFGEWSLPVAAIFAKGTSL